MRVGLGKRYVHEQGQLETVAPFTSILRIFYGFLNQLSDQLLVPSSATAAMFWRRGPIDGRGGAVHGPTDGWTAAVAP